MKSILKVPCICVLCKTHKELEKYFDLGEGDIDKLFVDFSSKVISMMKDENSQWKMEYACYDNLCVSIRIELGRIKSIYEKWTSTTNPSQVKT